MLAIVIDFCIICMYELFQYYEEKFYYINLIKIYFNMNNCS